jgi:hypothetical protein
VSLAKKLSQVDFKVVKFGVNTGFKGVELGIQFGTKLASYNPSQRVFINIHVRPIVRP